MPNRQYLQQLWQFSKVFAKDVTTVEKIFFAKRHFLIGAICKWLAAIGKFMIGITLATNGEKITNAMVGNGISANYW